MRITTSEYNKVIDIGTSGIWYSMYSTIEVRVPEGIKSRALKARAFFKTGTCECEDALETARELNLLRDALANIPPEDAVFDMNNLGRIAPWAGHTSPIVTSCANLFTTADGKDLFSELVSILCYAGINAEAVIIN